jgi:hypothetical protein
LCFGGAESDIAVTGGIEKGKASQVRVRGGNDFLLEGEGHWCVLSSILKEVREGGAITVPVPTRVLELSDANKGAVLGVKKRKRKHQHQAHGNAKITMSGGQKLSQKTNPLSILPPKSGSSPISPFRPLSSQERRK